MKRLVPSALVRLPTRWLVGTGALLVGLALLGLALGPETSLIDSIWLPIALAVSYAPLALFVLRKLPEHPVGRLMLGTGLMATLSFLATAWSRWTPAAWLSQWLWWPPFALIPLALLLFPDGRLPTRRWRFVAAALIVAAVVTTLALAAAAAQEPRTLVSTVGTPAPSWVQALARVAVGGILATVALTVVVGFALVQRWRRAGWLERRQIACLAPSAGLVAVSIALSFTELPGAWIPAVVALPLAFTFAILQYRLFDLDLIIHRGLVWILLSLIAVSIYAITVAGLAALVSPSRSWTANLLAGAAVAAILLPAERVAQRAAQRLLFGQRDDPYRVLVQAGRHVEAIRDPLAVLPQLVETLVTALRVPSAAIEFGRPGSDRPLRFAAGRATTEPPQEYAMVAHGSRVGTLAVAPRQPGGRFSTAESRLLQDLAAQAALAAEACRASLELQSAREQLVLAREEERRRLRHDLHDGVASALVGARMLTTAVLDSAALEIPTRRVLQTLDHDLEVCSAEIRTVIDGLRPASLDHGLEPALRLAAQTLGRTLDLRLRTSGSLADLPAAAEVVALRVATEALANVAKHSAATGCTVALDRTDDQLSVTVTDNGRGLPDDALQAIDRGTGVGLDSIRYRVEEIGGTVTMTSSPAGFTLHVVLPARRTSNFGPVDDVASVRRPG